MLHHAVFVLKRLLSKCLQYYLNKFKFIPNLFVFFNLLIFSCIFMLKNRLIKSKNRINKPLCYHIYLTVLYSVFSFCFT